jgi:hypothetical protein
MTEEIEFEKITQVFVPELMERFKAARENNLKFVQYTSSSAAIEIIRNDEIWLRNVSCMNDFLEIEYGLERIVKYFSSETTNNFWAALDSKFESISIEIKKTFDDWRSDLTLNTYIACVSEHDESENQHGRLSMWRAYANDSGVAIVVNGNAMLSESDAIRAYTFPVFYKSDAEVEQLFDGFTQKVTGMIDWIGTVPRENIQHYFDFFFKTYALSLKHPAFKEEREWRIVYRPKEYPDGKLIKRTKVINGLPQRIYALPLKNIPESGLVGVEVSELIDRILIGPTDHALPILHALIDTLEEKNISNPNSKVFVTNIPLRMR